MSEQVSFFWWKFARPFANMLDTASFPLPIQCRFLTFVYARVVGMMGPHDTNRGSFMTFDGSPVELSWIVPNSGASKQEADRQIRFAIEPMFVPLVLCGVLGAQNLLVILATGSRSAVAMSLISLFRPLEVLESLNPKTTQWLGEKRWRNIFSQTQLNLRFRRAASSSSVRGDSRLSRVWSLTPFMQASTFPQLVSLR
jgi:hypothetical protein